MMWPIIIFLKCHFCLIHEKSILGQKDFLPDLDSGFRLYMRKDPFKDKGYLLEIQPLIINLKINRCAILISNVCLYGYPKIYLF